MSYRLTSLRSKAVAVPLTMVLAGVGLTACSDDTAGSEAGADVEAIQEDDIAAADAPVDEVGEPPEAEDAPVDPLVFGEDFDDAQSFVGQEVTVSADVDEVIAPGVFTIAGTGNTSLEPLRVVADPTTDVTEDAAIAVTGTVHQYSPDDLAEAEEVLGDDFDPSLFEDVEEGEPYIVATAIDPTVTEG